MSRALEFRDNWLALLGCCLGVSVGMGTLFLYTSGAFLAAITEQVGWSSAKYSGAHLIYAVGIVIGAPLIGALMDRIGVLQVIALGFVGEGLGFLLLGIVSAQYETFIILHGLLAFFGVGSTAIPFTRIISERFEKMRGLALAIAVSGAGVTAVVAPPIMIFVNTTYGWHMGYLMLAAVVAVGGPISLWLIGKNSPERLSLPKRVPIDEMVASFNRLFRIPFFWALLSIIFVFMTCTNGYVVHFIKLLSKQGMSSTDAAQMQSVVGLSIIFGRLASGVLVDWIFAPRVAAAFMACTAAAFFGIEGGDPMWRIPAAIGLGLTIGAELDMAAYLVSRYFSIEDFGRVFGLLYAVIIIASGASPLLIAVVSKHGAQYSTALLLSAIVSLLCAAIALFAPKFPENQA